MDVVLTAILGVVVLYVLSGLRVFKEYERGVLFVLGRSWGAKGPGLRFLPPLLTKIQTVSLRVVALDVPPQDVITRDNISIKVNAVLYMRVADPVKAVIGVENFLYATSQLAQTTLRSVLGETELDELLMNREKINNILKNIIDKRAEDWGIEVSAVEVKDVDLPPEMKRAMARQAEAERERRAKVINAEGELQASEKLAQAARIIGAEPAAIPLRYLQTVTEISSENNSTTFFPIPIDLLKGFLDALARKPVTPARPETTSAEALPAAPTVDRALGSWMQGEELLQVKRRYADRTTWEPKVGAFASIQRALGSGGRRFALARATEIASQVVPLEAGFCHVQLLADVRNIRRERVTGAGVLLGAGGAATAALVAMGVLAPFPWLPLVVLGPAAVAVLRSHRHQHEQIQTGLEQALDRLERGEIKPEHALPSPKAGAFERIANEIRRTIDHLSET